MGSKRRDAGSLVLLVVVGGATALAGACAKFESEDGPGPGPDAGSISDAGPAQDAPATPDATLDDAGSFCRSRDAGTSTTSFCDDFDDDAPFAAKWRQDVGDGGMLAASSEARSLPRAFAAAVGPTSTITPVGARLRRPFVFEKAVTKRMALSFAARIAPLPKLDSGFVSLATIRMNGVPCEGAGVQTRDFSLVFVEAGTYIGTTGLVSSCTGTQRATEKANRPTATIVDGQYHLVVIEATTDLCTGKGGAGAVRLRIDGELTACFASPVSPLPPADIDVFVGAYVDDFVHTLPIGVTVDDVTFEAE